jgi:hypothetical protein
MQQCHSREGGNPEFISDTRCLDARLPDRITIEKDTNAAVLSFRA